MTIFSFSYFVLFLSGVRRWVYWKRSEKETNEWKKERIKKATEQNSLLKQSHANVVITHNLINHINGRMEQLSAENEHIFVVHWPKQWINGKTVLFGRFRSVCAI